MGLSLAPILKSNEIKQIHAQSLNLLERVGIDYKTPRALEVLEKMGCRVDYERTWASLPPDLVEWSLVQAPRVVRLPARTEAFDILHNHKPPPLPAGAGDKLEAILAEADRELSP